MNRLFALTYLIVFSASSSMGQLEGTWQGVLIRAGQSISSSAILYANFESSDGDLSGRMRNEIYNSEFYALKKLNGSIEGGTIDFKEIVVEKNKRSSKYKWCRLVGSLKYDSLTGYLSGSYTSSDCKRNIGKIILYRASFELSLGDESKSSHHWFDQFVKDYNEGLSAPEIRKKERDNFVFEPIFFDFDKANIRVEHNAFLDRLIKVVKGHTDLRVMVTGHTDSDGPGNYNIGLSKRRAESIIEYFKANGLDADRLRFDFKGETRPADTNGTPEGKQNNRRVDFEFI